MARRSSQSDEAAGQLSLWAEASVPSSSQGEGQDEHAATAHRDGRTPTPALPLRGGGRPSLSTESRTAVTSPSPSQGEGRDGGSAVAPNERPTPASPPKSKPLRAVAACKDSIACSERALAAIRSILASESREEAARHAAAFRRNR